MRDKYIYLTTYSPQFATIELVFPIFKKNSLNRASITEYSLAYKGILIL